jgi:hypothetical protein
MTSPIFRSAQCDANGLAGVFEFDGEAGYFYLYQTSGPTGSRVIDSMHVVSGREVGFSDDDVFIRWDAAGKRVALFIREVIWAVFDSSDGKKYGGNYKPAAAPEIPKAILTSIRN